jgi:GNAT superfamily N-acetyltransferase
MKILEEKIEDALFVIKEVAHWLIDTGQPLWKIEDLTEEKLQKDQAKNFIVAYKNEEPAAAMILQWKDKEFWPEINENESGFIHKLSVRRKYKGQGIATTLIDYASSKCLEKGITFLRLDCDATRSKLCKFYKENGFIEIRQKKINSYAVALFEKSLKNCNFV